MAAQEFSSPGEHMASSGGSSGSFGMSSNGSVADSVGVSPSESNIIWALNAGSNKGSYNSHSSRDDYETASNKFNQSYMDYNYNLYSNARDWSEYMSNTSIRRQVEDLKAAGLNPVLATRLGGASYQSVNVPYLTINPSSALQAFTGYDASLYASDMSFGASIYNADISSATQLANNASTNATNAYIATMSRTSNEYIASLNNTAREALEYGLKDKELQNQMQILDKQLQNWKEQNAIGNTSSYSGFLYNIGKQISSMSQNNNNAVSTLVQIEGILQKYGMTTNDFIAYGSK